MMVLDVKFNNISIVVNNRRYRLLSPNSKRKTKCLIISSQRSKITASKVTKPISFQQIDELKTLLFRQQLPSRFYPINIYTVAREESLTRRSFNCRLAIKQRKECVRCPPKNSSTPPSISLYMKKSVRRGAPIKRLSFSYPYKNKQ